VESLSVQRLTSAILGVAASLTATAAIGQEPKKSIALTFDDLPFADTVQPGSAIEQARALRASAKIQSALQRHSAPAIGFVIESKVQELGAAGRQIVRSWNHGSFEIGNHGFSHADSNNLTIAQIEQEVARGELTIRPMAERAHRPIRFYRFAYNHVGDSEEKRAAVEQLLGRRGYRLAASTIDTSDYIFAQAFERALAQNDSAMQSKIEDTYLSYTKQEIQYYRDLDRQVLGYEQPEIILLHLSSLNAAVMDRILAILRSMHYRFVTLDEAQADPAYRHSPAVATKFGPMWGYRWARERGVKVNGSLEQDPPQWVQHYGEAKQ
jgi:peptidoglycan/xylan/chitin deacetylase (PgdA/CDA1 family)